MFSWDNFLRQHDVEFITSGPNVSRGNYNIHCPYCGDSDPSMHMGLNIEKGYWGCWRVKQHRGKNPRRLIQTLLGCSYEYSLQLVNNESVVLSNNIFDQVTNLLHDIYSIHKSNLDQEELKLIPEFKSILKGGNWKQVLIVSYLQSRGYSEDEIVKLCKDYDLRYCVRGPFTYRIIFPIYMEQGLVNWTGRTISDSTIPRYKTLSTDKEKSIKEGLPTALLSIKDTFWNYKDLIENPGYTLVLCEGPFDSLKIDFFGKKRGVRSTCLFNKDISKSQLLLLEELSFLYQRKILLLDRDAVFDAELILNEIERFGFERGILQYANDPAELTKEDVLAI